MASTTSKTRDNPVVAVTGASEYLGRRLVEHLQAGTWARRICVVDVREPPCSTGPRTRSCPVDLTQPEAGAELARVFRRNQVDILVHLARGWTFLADGHLTEPEARREVLSRALQWATSCRELDTAFVEMVAQGGGPDAQIVRSRSRNHLPCLYWNAEALILWAELEGPSTYLRHVDDARTWMLQVQAVEPDYHFGGPDRFLGVYYLRIPTFAGRDTGLAHEHLERAIAAAPEWFANRVALATSWAVDSQDRALFEEQLQMVLDADPHRFADWVPEQLAERRKAQRLLENADSLFR